jgi:uncharacterized protein YecE (DUF72 family)
MRTHDAPRAHRLSFAKQPRTAEGNALLESPSVAAVGDELNALRFAFGERFESQRPYPELAGRAAASRRDEKACGRNGKGAAAEGAAHDSDRFESVASIGLRVVGHARRLAQRRAGEKPFAVAGYAAREDTSAVYCRRAMRVLVGTSGYSYKEWKGPFYPKDLAEADFLRYYAERLATVEINNTFYRMPTEKLIEGWAKVVPETFTFALKAPQRITHIAKLQNAGDPTGVFARIAGTLGPRLGPLLFQLPPFLRKDVPRLRAFLESAPPSVRIAFEFRHASWFDDEVWDALRSRQAALCVAEGESIVSPVVATADWGYVRLRRDAYSDEVLSAWATTIRAQPWKEAFVYVKHDEGDAPSVAKRLAQRFLESIG